MENVFVLKLTKNELYYITTAKKLLHLLHLNYF